MGPMGEGPEDVARLARELAAVASPLRKQLELLNTGSAAAEAMRSIAASARINDSLVASVTRALDAGKPRVISPAFLQVLEANRNLGHLLGQTRFTGLGASEAFQSIAKMQGISARFTLSESMAASLAKLNGSTGLAASLVVQEKLSFLKGASFGALVAADSTFRRSTAAHLGLVARSYDAVMKSAAANPPIGRVDWPVVASTVPLDFYRHVEAIETVTLTRSEAYSSETVEAAVAEAGPSIDDLLGQFDSRLLPLLRGARDALRSRNPDRPRHVTTSLRELFTQVLHALAPDSAVKVWSTNKEDFARGRPTRRARLMYVCRGIDSEPLAQYVKADVSATLTFIDSLQAGTHAVASNLTERQLRAQVIRMETLLALLLQIAWSDTCD